jgi:[acyl-carrier-protein] S-malonyltransferase
MNETPTALLFAGQGSERVGMAASLPRECEPARAVLEAADRALGEPLSRLMREGPETQLRRTAYAQPALLAVAVAQARYLLARGLSPRALAGHSLGQYAALVVADSISLEDALRAVAERGRLMQATVAQGEGAMATIVGLEVAKVEAACARAKEHGVVVTACFNAPRQLVISGERAAVEAAAEACEAGGAGVIMLSVSVPFHCPLLRPMVPAFAEVLSGLAVRAPRVPVIDNVTAAPLTTAEEVRRALIEHIEAPVRFEDSLRLMAARGVSRFVACGPGNAQLSFAKRTCPNVERLRFEDLLDAHEGYERQAV